MFTGLLRNILIFALYCTVNIANAQPTHYVPTHDSISKHSLPEWYDDAKFGIMIHYGLYSIPAWAPLNDPTGKLLTDDFFINNPYGAWYMNSMQIKSSPTYQYHRNTFGANFNYDNFIPMFTSATKQWQPDDWSSLFAKAGAKYVVLVTKHHDGYALWNSRYQNPYKSQYYSPRNIVNEFTESTRKYNMRVGLYYSGGYDWSWQETYTPPITNILSAILKIPQTQAYADYVDHQWHELIETYHPDLIWNDIALPQKVNKFKLFADYYNTVPDGVLNNRWAQSPGEFMDLQPDDATIAQHLKSDWFDYYSPEYLPAYQLSSHKWEADHGPGYGFEYNRNEYEHPEHFKNLDQLIADLADIVSKNGNLLLAIGPMADGTIPELEKNLLLGIGQWLEVNGEAIYATRPWKQAEGSIKSDSTIIPVRFTQDKTKHSLYVIVLQNPHGNHLILENIQLDRSSTIEILNNPKNLTLSWQQEDNNIIIDLTNQIIPKEHAIVLKISPTP